jgi:hypothetical protein
VGADGVTADAIDTVAPDCEQVNGGGAGPKQDPKLEPGAGCVVPKLRGLRMKAKAKLARAGCKAKVRRVGSRRVRRGRVIAQGARAGRQLPAGTTVKLKVSRGASASPRR